LFKNNWLYITLAIRLSPGSDCAAAGTHKSLFAGGFAGLQPATTQAGKKFRRAVI
jgi:hypothetical protein